MDSRLRILFILAAGGLLAYFVFLRKPDGPPPRRGDVPTVPTPETRGAPRELARVQSGGLAATVTTYSGALRDIELTSGQFREPRTGAPLKLATTWLEPYLPLRSNVVFERDGQNVLPQYLTFAIERRTPTSVELVANPPGTDVEVRRTIQSHTDYALRVATRVVNHGAPGRLRYSQGIYHYVLRSAESGSFFRQSWQRTEGLCNHHEDVLYREAREEIAKRGADNDNIASQAHFTGIGNLYFLYALVPQGAEPAACHLRSEDRFAQGAGAGDEPIGSLLISQLSYAPAQLATHEAHEYRAIGYFGPKLGSALSAAAPTLHEAVNLGFFAIIARGLLKLLQFLYSVVHNWGVAVILLTVIVRTALYPVLSRGTKSMAMMQKIKPETDAINERYKDDPQARTLATQELWKANGINPVLGCLPQLAQLPVFWALYTTLQTSVELFHAPFTLWWRDLSAPDPYYVLPLVLGVVMFLQQKIMPPAMPDPVQAKMMLYAMPIFLTGISLFLPAGLALYMLVNSVLAIIQQRITKAQIDRIVRKGDGSGGSGIEVRPAPAVAIAPGGEPGRGGGRRGGRK